MAKVLLLNGSPHKAGCTATALGLVQGELEAAGVECEAVWLGNDPSAGCMACH